MEIKQMTRGQIKELRKAGLDLLFVDETIRKDSEKAGQIYVMAQEWILDNVYDFSDEVSYGEQMEYARKTFEKYQESLFPRREEIKN